MLSIGFDPSFIDTLVWLNDKNGDLITDIPPLGMHHRTSLIKRVAGGNGVNISYILNKLNLNHYLIISVNDYYMSLLEKRGIRNIIPIKNANISETVALITKNGEIQCNYFTTSLGIDHWSPEIHKYWQNSSINVFLNWGLNKTALEWVSIQWLASCGWSYDEIINIDNYFSTAINTTNCEKSIIIEPGSIKHHKDSKQLYKLLEHISLNTEDLIFSANEEEKIEFSKFIFTTKIIHTKNYVLTYNKDNIIDKIKVIPIENAINFVGAGDAFLAGLIYDKYKYNRLNVNFAIKVAQQFIKGKL